MKLIVAFLTLFSVFLVYAQEDLVMRVEGKITDFDAGKKMGGVKVTFKSGGAVVATTTTASNGKYSYDLKAGKVYNIVYSYPGYVSKIALLDGTSIVKEDLPSGAFVPMPELDLDLFKKRDNVDFSFLKTQPVAEFRYNKTKGVIYPDIPKLNAVKKKINDLLNQAEKKAKEEESKYNQWVEQGDKLYDDERYEEALVKYKDANNLKPAEPHPNERIVEIEDLLSALKKEKLKEEQANQEYQNLLTAAKNLLDNKEFDKALDKYDEASALRPEESYPLDQIDRIYDLKKKAEQKKLYDEAIKLADNFMKQNSLKAALDKYKEAALLDPSQEYPKKQIKQLEEGIEAQKEVAAKKEEYKKLVAAGDQLFTEEKLEEAKEKFQAALAIESAASYPAGKIKVIDEKLKELADAKAKEEAYQKAITAGNAAFTEEKFDDAIAKYNEALAVKADDSFAKDQIEKVKAAKKKAEELAQQKELQEKFDALVLEADGLKEEEKYSEAIAKYKEAKALKEDAGVDAKISEIEALLAEKKQNAEKEAQITELMASADAKLTAKDFSGAITDFDKVLALDSENEEAKTKKEEAQKSLDELSALKEQAEQIAKLKADGQAAFDAEGFATAITKYTEVLSIDESDSDAKAKLEEAKSAKASKEENEALEKSYAEKIAAGDKAREEERYADAKAFFKEAKEVKSQETYPDTQIAEIDEILAKQAAADALSEKQSAYDEKILAAGTEKANENYSAAIAILEEAKTILPENPKAQEEIDAINLLIEEKNKAEKEKENQAKIDQQYTEKMTAAKTAKEKEQYDLALMLFKEASEIKTEEEEPKQEIESINSLLAKQKEEEGAAAVKAAYDAKVAEAEAAKEEEKYDVAITLYKEAKSIKADETYPDEQIAVIQELQKEQDQAIQQAEIQKEYDEKVAAAASAKEEEKYDDALSLYKEAQKLKPAEELPQQEIEQINALIEKLNAKEKEADQLANYNEKIASADEAFADGELENARSLYQEALKIKSDENYPNKQIEKINEKLEELKSNAALAKAQEQFDAKFQEALTEKENKNFKEAIVLLKEAQSILPEDKTAQKEIEAINKLLEGKEEEAAERLAEYKEFIEKADEARDAEKLDKAVELYEKAKIIIPEEEYPQLQIDAIAAKKKALNEASKLAEIDAEYAEKMEAANGARDKEQFDEAKMLYKEALEIKPEESQPTTEINKINSLLEEREMAELNAEKKLQYQSKIEEADIARNNEEFTEALKLYKDAKDLQPNETYPDTQIKLINDAIALEEQKEANAETQKAFESALAKADAAFDNKEYNSSINLYKTAFAIKEDDYPKSQITKAELAIASEKQNEAQQAINSAINKADVAFKNENYKESIGLYEKVLDLDSDNAKAKDKIAEAQQILDNIAAEKQKAKENEAQYNALLTKGDKLFKDEKYKQAKNAYRESMAFANGRPYPRNQIRKIDKKLKEETKSEEGEVYAKLIAAADNNFNEGDLEKAKSLYTRATNLKKNDVYPKSQLKKIEALLAKPAKEPGELADLGTQEAISLEEGAQLLLEAEKQRKANKQNKLTEEIDKAGETFEENRMTDADERQKALELANQSQEDFQERDASAEEKRREAIDIVDQKQDDLRNKRVEESKFERAENLRTQDYVDATQGEIRERNMAKSGEIQESVDYLESQKDAVALTRAENLKAKEERTQATYDILQEEFDDEALSGDYEAEKAAALKVMQTIEEQDVKMYEESINQQAALEAKEEMLKNAQLKVIAENEKESQANAEMQQRTEDLIEGAKSSVADKSKEGQLLRQENVAELDKQQDNLAAKQREDNTKERAQELATQQKIQNTEEEIRDRTIEKSAEQADVQKEVENQQDIVKRSNEEKRDANKDGISKTRQAIEEQENSDVRNAAEQAEIAKKANAQIDQKVDDVVSDQSKKSKENKENTLKTQAFLDGLEENTVKFNETVANALGDKFPEGVTQQNFVRRDSEGLPVKIVTRRIVVANGRGNVYIRIQSKFGTTYSKNGVSITSTVWDKETDNGKLEKHY